MIMREWVAVAGCSANSERGFFPLPHGSDALMKKTQRGRPLSAVKLCLPGKSGSNVEACHLGRGKASNAKHWCSCTRREGQDRLLLRPRTMRLQNPQTREGEMTQGETPTFIQTEETD